MGGPRASRCAAALACSFLVFAASAAPVTAEGETAGNGVLLIKGRGWGHGVGMAQEGAFSMAKDGADVGRILAHFYPGTSTGSRGGVVRVPVFLASSMTAVLAFPSGGQVDVAGGSTSGFPVRVGPGGRVRLSHSSATYRAEVLGGASAGPRPAMRPIAAVRPARGDEASARDVYVAPSETTTSTEPTTTTTASTTTPTEATTSTSTTTTMAPGSAAPTTPPNPPNPGAGPAGRPPTVGPSSAGPPVGVPAPAPTATAPLPANVPGVASAQPLTAVATGGGTVSVEGRGRQYRGSIEAKATGGGLRLVNQVDIEDYLRGMGEVRDGSWPAAALETQAVAARTYALRAMAKVGEVCDDTRCQVYLGATAEYPQMDQAVARTRGRVLTYGGSLAATVYSANGGGITADTQEGFGTPPASYPYLRVGPYASRNPSPWTIRADLSEVARRIGYQGRLSEVRVSKAGPSNRPLEVVAEGDAGAQTMSGLALVARLGLRSNLFSLGAGTPGDIGSEIGPDGAGAVDELPPASEIAAIQSLPDQVPIGFSRIVAQASGANLAPRSSGGGHSAVSQILRLFILVGLGGVVLGRRKILGLFLDR